MMDFGMSAGVSGMLGGLTEAAGARVQQQWANKASRHQRKFQEMMSSTAYQRAVVDLKAAGLNPALAYMQGGASTPPGSKADVPDIDIAGGVARGVSSARQVQRVSEELGILRAQRKTAENEADASRYASDQAFANVGETYMRQSLLEDQALQARANRKYIDTQNALGTYGLPAAAADAAFYSTEFGQAMRNVDRTIGTVGPLVGRFLTGARGVRVGKGFKRGK